MQSRQLVTLWILEYSLSYSFALKHSYLAKIQLPCEKGLNPFNTLPPAGCFDKQAPSLVVCHPENDESIPEIGIYTAVVQLIV